MVAAVARVAPMLAARGGGAVASGTGRATSMAKIRNANILKQPLLPPPGQKTAATTATGENIPTTRERLEKIAEIARKEAKDDPENIGKQREALKAERELALLGDDQGEGQKEATPTGKPNQIQRIGGNVSRIFRNVGEKIAGFPSPGSLAFPIVVLLIFFMILIRINGHSRMEWLWLVITGNAQIGGDNVGGGGGTNIPDLEVNLSNSTQKNDQIVVRNLSGTTPRPATLPNITFTGVEDT